MTKKKNATNQKGYILLGVLILVALSSIAAVTSMDRARTHIKTTDSVKKRARRFYKTEESINKALSWMRTNSKYLANAFSRDYYYDTMDFNAPAYGANDLTYFRVPSRLFYQGSTASIMFSSSYSIGYAVFPTAYHLDTGAMKNLPADFYSSDLGDANVRATFISTRPLYSGRDYGDPDSGNHEPETDFHHVIRLDAMEAVDRGAHSYAYLISDMHLEEPGGYFGRDYIELNRDCDSWRSTGANPYRVYDASYKEPNCVITSHGEVRIKSGKRVNGSVSTTGTINVGVGWGGNICGTFGIACGVPGEVCEDPSCDVDGLPLYDTWATYCPTDQGDYKQALMTTGTLTTASDAAADKCWNLVQVRTPSAITSLTSSEYPYFFKTLDLGTAGRLEINPTHATGIVEIYVEKFTGNLGPEPCITCAPVMAYDNELNSQRFINMLGDPKRVIVHYLGTDDITLNGSLAHQMFLIAPYANVTVAASADYQGGLRATGVTFNSSAFSLGTPPGIHWDETAFHERLVDVTYEIRKYGSYYR